MNAPRPGQHIRLVETYVKSGTVVTYVGRVYGAGSDVVEFDGGVMAYFNDYVSSVDMEVSVAATWEAELEPLPTTPGSVIRVRGMLWMRRENIYLGGATWVDDDRDTHDDPLTEYEIVFDAGAAT